MTTIKKDDTSEPIEVDDEIEELSETQEKDQSSSESSKAEAENGAGSSGENKRKRTEDDEEGDENLNEIPASVGSSDPTLETSAEVDKIGEEALNVSPSSDKGNAKRSTIKGSKPGPLSKKPKQIQPEQPATAPQLSDGIAVAQATTPQPVSYLALIPVNQPGTSSSSDDLKNKPILALPLQQTNSGLSSLVAMPAANVAAASAGSSENTVTAGTSHSDSESSAIGEQSSKSLKSKVSKLIDDSRAPLITTGVDKSTGKGARSKKAKTRVPYRHAQPIHKKTERRTRNAVSDFNSSDEDDDGTQKIGSEMAALFYKKFGESKATGSKSLMDKLHRSIFQDLSSSESEEEEEEISSEKVLTGKTPFKVVNCPGPGKYEAFVGPLNNSKLSVIRMQEFTQVKNHWYEIYKVRVTSSGREANTNILIPVPQGYKVYVPSKCQETPVEFTHTAHEDFSSVNRISPKFLEKLANTELKLRKYKDEVKVLRTRYIELLKEYANRPQFSTVSDLVGAASKFLTEDQLVFFLMQLKSGAHNMQGIRYSVREKVLALSIYQKSPEVYKWLRKLLNLPSKAVLERWLEDVGCQDPQLLKKLMYHVYANYNFKRNTL